MPGPIEAGLSGFSGDMDSIRTAVVGDLNDLWRFDPATSEWTWMAGSDLVGEPGNYVTSRTSRTHRNPGGRELDMAWIDAVGRFWLWGGYGYDSVKEPGALNDLWYFIGSMPPAPAKERPRSGRIHEESKSG